MKLHYKEQIFTLCAPPWLKRRHPPSAQAHVAACFQEKDANRVSTGNFAVAARESARGKEAAAFRLTQRGSDATAGEARHRRRRRSLLNADACAPSPSRLPCCRAEPNTQRPRQQQDVSTLTLTASLCSVFWSVQKKRQAIKP